MATLMSDEVFHEVAYRAKNRDHLLAGVDEFLDAVTVLPPGEWDPQYEFQKFHKWIRTILLFTYRVLFQPIIGFVLNHPQPFHLRYTIRTLSFPNILAGEN